MAKVTHTFDNNGNPIIEIETLDGSKVFMTYDKALQKYYYQDLYNLEKPKNFNLEHARSLEFKERLKYLKKSFYEKKLLNSKLPMLNHYLLKHF